MESEIHSCTACRFLRRETESWEMPDIWWWECIARPSMANLKSFPFDHTHCDKFSARREETEHDRR